jgi:hypothetical protein
VANESKGKFVSARRSFGFTQDRLHQHARAHAPQTKGVAPS